MTNFFAEIEKAPKELELFFSFSFVLMFGITLYHISKNRELFLKKEETSSTFKRCLIVYAILLLLPGFFAGFHFSLSGFLTCFFIVGTYHVFVNGIRKDKEGFKIPTLKILGLCALAFVLCLGVNFMTNFIYSLIEYEAPQQNAVKILLEIKKQGILAQIVTILTISIAVPIMEEIVFRRFLYVYVRGIFGVGKGIVMSASIFSFVHFDFGFFVPLFLLGVIFSFFYETTKSLTTCTIIHGLNNLFAILTLWYLPNLH